MAAFLLELMGEEAISPLLHAVKEKDRELRGPAAEVLAMIGAPAVPALADAMGDSDPEMRRWAAWAPGEIGPAARAARSLVVKALHDENASVRDQATRALKSIDRLDAKNLWEVLSPLIGRIALTTFRLM
jgi:HEAT repeat protein